MSDQLKYYVVRTDDDVKDWIWKELQAGRLRQGWGISGMGLDENGVSLSIETWTRNYREAALRRWGVEASADEAAKRYSILIPMTYMTKGDIVLVPKMPDWESFALMSVDQGYCFDESPASERDGLDDYRHTISVSQVKHFNYACCEDARIVAKKMRAYQAAVRPAWNVDLIAAVTRLYQNQTDNKPLEITEIFAQAKAGLTAELLQRIRLMKWNDLEKLVEMALIEGGYELVQRRKYDRQGGDADLIMTTTLPMLSEFIGTDLNLYVQVKNKDGIDQDDCSHVEQLNKIAKDDFSCVKLLVSSADDFTPAAKRLAEENNVIMMNGPCLVRMLNKYL